MKKIITAIKFILVWFLVFFIILCFFVAATPMSENDTLELSSAQAWILLAVPLLSAYFLGIRWKPNVARIIKRNTTQKEKPIHQNCEPRIPKTKKAQETLATQLLDEITINVSLANKAEHIGLFVDYYDDAIKGFEILSKLDKVEFKGSPQYDLFRLRDEFQWHLCDALNRHKERTISEIQGKYKNSREFQEREYIRFKTQVDELQCRFSEQTKIFANECVAEIEGILGITLKENHTKTPLSCGKEVIDYMEGHEFEYWCADLLRKIGFQKVTVTQGSGDQGVDILAEKDGIRYAIQCKCYSSDLGNKPIQEVNTGKAIYHCHVGAVMTNRHFTPGGKQAAEATGVLLWDRDWIMSKL